MGGGTKDPALGSGAGAVDGAGAVGAGPVGRPMGGGADLTGGATGGFGPGRPKAGKMIISLYSDKYVIYIYIIYRAFAPRVMRILGHSWH